MTKKERPKTGAGMDRYPSWTPQNGRIREKDKSSTFHTFHYYRNGNLCPAGARIVGVGGFTGVAASNAKPFVCVVPTATTSNGETCQPKSSLIYVKTHKTGSSTLSNIFHRVPQPGGADTYHMFISAHTKYSERYIEPLVPGAEHVTVLRSPSNHFLSSWNYWGVPEHMKTKSGDSVTVDQLLDNPKEYWSKGLRSDRDLLENSMAFDLGLEKSSPKSAVEALIAKLEHWFVMITEYMDHSLVLLRRRMCWDLDDVVYYGIKVSGGSHKRKQVDPVQAIKIRRLSWMDAMLYDHFNASLWREIAATPGFDAELAELRRRKTNLAQECAKFSGMDVDGHRAHMLGERARIGRVEMKCHLFQLDSEGFVKYLKQWSGVPHLECHRQGRPLKSAVLVPIPFTGADRVANIYHRFSLRHSLRPALPRFGGMSFGSAAAPGFVAGIAPLPKKHFEVKQPGPGRVVAGYDVLASASFRYDLAGVQKVVGGALVYPQAITTMLREPVDYFWAVWTSPAVAKARAKAGVTEIETFLSNPGKYLEKLPGSIQNMLRNGQSYALGMSPGGTHTDVQLLIADVQRTFPVVMIADYYDESIVLFRRVFCWPRDDIIADAPALGTKARSVLPRAVVEALTGYLWADMQLFHAFNASFWRAVTHGIEINFYTEVTALQEARAKKKQRCSALIGSANELSQQSLAEKIINIFPSEGSGNHLALARAMMAQSDSSEDAKQFDCLTMHLQSPGFVSVLAKLWEVNLEGAVAGLTAVPPQSAAVATRSSRRRGQPTILEPNRGATANKDSDTFADATGGLGVLPEIYQKPPPDAECAAKKFIYLKTHKTGSSTMLSIFHRYAYKRGLLSALPIDNMYLGWPTARGALSSFTTIPGVEDYDVFCSGHATWSKKYLREIVPTGKQVTILREPVSQFVSSWNHWHPYEHIVSMGGPSVTMDQFLDEPTKYWKYAKWSDEALLHNSYSYDFGITSKPSIAQVNQLILDLKTDFDLVLLTEYMDESLVMLKRIFCWTVDDITHYSLKVTREPGHAKKKPAPALAAKIRKLNYADVKIYDELNKTFWEKLEVHTKDPTFWDDVKQLREQRSKVMSKCEKYINWPEDLHRKVIADLKPDPDECHLYLLDSKGFVKMLKRRVGIQTSECRTVSVFHMKHLAVIAPRWTQSERFKTFGYRAAFKAGAFPDGTMVPREPGTVIDWDHPERLRQSFRSGGAKFMPELHARYHRRALDEMVPGNYFIAFLEDPVIHFARIYATLLAEQTKSGVGMSIPMTLPAFVDQLISGNVRKEISDRFRNPQTYDIAGTRNPGENLRSIKVMMKSQFKTVLITNRPVESMILLRREICFDRTDIVSLGIDEHEPRLPEMSEATAEKIRNLNSADVDLYTHFNDEMSKVIADELYWNEEVQELSAWNRQVAAKCTALAHATQAEHVKWLVDNKDFAFESVQSIFWTLKERAAADRKSA